MTDTPPYLNYSALGWGIYTSLRKPPEGFDWVQSGNDWLYLRDYHGRFFYVNFEQKDALLLILRKKATFWDWICTQGVLKPGQYFADYNLTFYIPNNSDRKIFQPHTKQP
jgi:hypothetical protein